MSAMLISRSIGDGGAVVASQRAVSLHWNGCQRTHIHTRPWKKEKCEENRKMKQP